MSQKIILGTDGTDTIEYGFVSSNGNSIDSYWEDLIVQAGRGNDTIITEDGNDTVYGVSGENYISTSFGDDVIYSGRHSSEIDASYGADTIFADLSKGGDHNISLGNWDYDVDKLFIDNVSLTKTSDVMVSEFQVDDYYGDELYIYGELVDFANLSDGMSLGSNDMDQAVLSFGDDDSITFTNQSYYALLGIESDYKIIGTSGNDYIDATYVDTDGDRLSDVYEVELGAGDDYLETDGGWLDVNLGDGADTVNLTQGSYVYISDLSVDDTVQFDGVNLSWAMLSEDGSPDSEDIWLYEGENSFEIYFNSEGMNLYVDNMSLVDYLGERGVIGQVDGTSGNDVITDTYQDSNGEATSSNADLVYAGAGDDVVKTYSGDDTVFGGDGNDSIYGDRNNNMLFGEDGDDVLGSGRHQSTLSGGEGDDVLIADMQKGGNHVLNGGNGMDTFDLRYASADKISDIVIQDFDPDLDTLKLGDELVDLSNLPEGATLANNEDDHAVLTLASGDTVKFENITTNDLLGIVELNGQVDGTDYADVINLSFVDAEGEMVGDSDDLVSAGSGKDIVYGYKGADTIYGGSGDDMLFGLKGQNDLYGETGDDTISSGKHTSLLDGGHGDDVLLADLGSGGDHTLVGGTGYDTLVLNNASNTKVSAVLVSDFDPEQDILVVEDTAVQFDNLMEGWSLSENDEGHAVLSFNDDDSVTLQGVGLNDLGVETPENGTVGIVDGTSDSDMIDDSFIDNEGDSLTDGNDTIMAGAGDDEVITDRGNDIVYGGAGNDSIGSLRGSNELYGEEGDDLLVALRHSSLLDGGEGDDILGGDLSKGADHTMTGGDGADLFALARTSYEKASHVTVTDFEVDADAFMLEGNVVSFRNLQDGETLADDEDGNAVFGFGDDDTVTFLGVSSEDIIENDIMSDLFIEMTEEELQEEYPQEEEALAFGM